MDTLSVKGVIDPKTIKIGQSPDTAVEPENLTVRHDHGAIPGTKPSAIDEPVVLTPEGQAFGKLALASNAMSAMDTNYSSWLVELVTDRNNRFFAVIRESGNPRVPFVYQCEIRGKCYLLNFFTTAFRDGPAVLVALATSAADLPVVFCKYFCSWSCMLTSFASCFFFFGSSDLVFGMRDSLS